MKTVAKKRQSGKGRVSASGSVGVYESIKKLIITGGLKPGSDLDESLLIKRFGVSRTPVRESIIRLSMEGLVTILPNRGAKVSSLDFSDVSDHLEVMEILTPSVCYLAALRRTQTDLDEIKKQIDKLGSVSREDVDERLDGIFNLYTAMGRAAKNDSLALILRSTIYARLRIGRIGGTRPETDSDWQEHFDQLHSIYKDIYRAIETRNAPKARSAAQELLRLIRFKLSAVISTSDVPIDDPNPN